VAREPQGNQLLELILGIYSLTPTLSSELGLAPLVLQREDAALNRVEEDVPRLEVRVDRPGAQELNHAVDRVVLGVAVKEADLLEVAAGRVGLDTRNVDDAKTRAVVGLVRQALDDLCWCWSVSIPIEKKEENRVD
jgi:hypothetical protein